MEAVAKLLELEPDAVAAAFTGWPGTGERGDVERKTAPAEEEREPWMLQPVPATPALPDGPAVLRSAVLGLVSRRESRA